MTAAACSAADVPATEVRELYLSRYENAKFWQATPTLPTYRLGVEGVYFIGGFGPMGWVSAEEYGLAQPDPLAESASGIIQHMNADHAEAVRLIARHYVGEDTDEAVMTAVDRLAFQVRLKYGDKVISKRVSFLREVSNSDNARGVLREMVRRARSDKSES